jgi:hypothetical protein
VMGKSGTADAEADAGMDAVQRRLMFDDEWVPRAPSLVPSTCSLLGCPGLELCRPACGLVVRFHVPVWRAGQKRLPWDYAH